MQRVLHLIAQYPDRTGSGTYMKSILKQGKISGWSQAALYAVNDGDEVDLSQYKLCREYPVKFKTQELPFPVVGMSDNMPYESTKYLDMSESMLERWKSAFLRAIKLAVKEFKPDLIYSHHLWLLTALVANEVADIPIRAFGHGTDIRQFRSGSMDRRYIVEGCRKLEKIFALTEYQRDSIVECYGISSKRVEVVGAGFDIDIFNVQGYSRPQLASKKGRIIYAGKLCESKGVKSLLRAYDRLEGDLELILAGNGEVCQKRELESLANQIDKEIRFVGHISQLELAGLFKSADLFVLPSFYEGLALVNIEAIASGLRVVSTDIEGIKEYMGPEINESGLIEYVELPNRDDDGEVSKKELLEYEERLEKSIRSQLSRRDRESDLRIYGSIYDSIRSKSWSEIFKKL